MPDNTLYYGDNLDVLRHYIQAESVDLIYLDPPFNSNRSYNVLFKEANGSAADAQITAFDDSWSWGPIAEETLREIEKSAAPHVVEMMQAIVRFVGRNDLTAYLVMMAVRLIELHRVLKPSGSLYLHCDPTASHYLKVMMDTIFGKANFRNEIIWKRRTGSSSSVHSSKKFGVCTDTILFYVKSGEAVLHPQYSLNAAGYQEYIDKFFRYTDENGRRYRLADLANPALRPNLIYEYKGYPPPKNGWAISREKMELWDREGRLHFPKKKTGRIQRKRFLDELKGKPVQSLWDDIEPVGAQAAERLGYPTQKPLALLERIIQASSNPGDLVLDPFCGCGTTVCAAQKLGRSWIGIDITHLAIALMRERLQGMFGNSAEYKVVGQPADLASAEQLARQDKYAFEAWALSLIKARPINEGKKGADRGLDGVLFFADEAKKFAKKAVVQVKGGSVQVSYIRDLRAVVEREKAALGFLITLERPSKPMLTETLSAGYYHSPGWNRDYQRLQIRTIEQLLAGDGFDYPMANVTLPQAEREAEQAKQAGLFDER